MNRRSFLMGLGVGLVLAGLASALLFGGRWHRGAGPAYRAPVESAPADANPESGWRADGRFTGGYYGHDWHRPHFFWGFPFMLMCFFPLIPLFFFMMMGRRRWHRGWHHRHHQAQPPIV
jgi:4-amino-4-deoxy-L-arabinose transferase-like glycosyltransferase